VSDSEADGRPTVIPVPIRSTWRRWLSSRLNREADEVEEVARGVVMRAADTGDAWSQDGARRWAEVAAERVADLRARARRWQGSP
jgi:hypothetical protein